MNAQPPTQTAWTIRVYLGRVYVLQAARTRDGVRASLPRAAEASAFKPAQIVAAVLRMVGEGEAALPQTAAELRAGPPPFARRQGEYADRRAMWWTFTKSGDRYGFALMDVVDGEPVPDPAWKAPPHEGTLKGAAKALAAAIENAPIRFPRRAPGDPPARLETGPPRVQSVLWMVRVHGGRAYVLQKARTNGGTLLTLPRAESADASSPAEVAATLMRMVRAGLPTVPSPTPEEMDELITREPFAEIAGKDADREASHWGLVDAEGRYYPVKMVRKGMVSSRDEGWLPPPHDATLEGAALALAEAIAGAPPPPPPKPHPPRKPAPHAAPEPAASIESVTALAAIFPPTAYPPTEDQLAAFEKEISAPLPPDFRRFLALTNGGHVPHDVLTGPRTAIPREFFALVEERGRPPTIAWYRTVLQDPAEPRLAFELLAIGHDDVDDVICVGLEGRYRGGIYLLNTMEPPPEDWDGKLRTAGNTRRIAASFGAFAAKFKIRVPG